MKERGLRRRGLSGVISTVLIILLAIAAVVIVWGFVSNLLEDTGSDVRTEELTTNLEIQKQSVLVDDSNKEVSFVLKRNSGEGDLLGFLVVLTDIDGETESFDIYREESLEELESRNIVLNYELRNVSKIEIYGVFESGVSHVLETYSIGDSGVESSNSETGGDMRDKDILEKLSGNIIGYWNFESDDNITAFDSSGNGYDGTYVGDAKTRDGLFGFGNGLDLEGSGDYIDIGEQIDFSGNVDFTVVLWMETRTDFNNYIIGTGNNNGWYMRVGKVYSSTEDGEIIFKIDDGTNDAYAFSGDDTNVADNEWHQVGISVSGDRMKGYIDGVEEVDLANAVGDMADGLRIGSISGAIGEFSGEIDDVIIFDIALNKTQIQELYDYYG